MKVRRIVPNTPTDDFGASRKFYVDFLGLTTAIDMGWIATFISPSHATSQISVVKKDSTPDGEPTITIEVDDVLKLHADALAQGYKIVYPLTDEPFGVRRFGVQDPSGMFINIMCHIDASGAVIPMKD